MGFTEGEWKANYHRVVINHPKCSDDGKVIATCNEWLKEAQANAHLIAAAPELYEALKGLIKEYWCNKGQDGKECPHPKEFIACITPDGYHTIPECWQVADRALAKVEGK